MDVQTPLNPVSPMSTHANPWRQSAGWLILVALAALLYLYGLDSFYAPTNGDEMVYIHIARMTAESGQWLPLQSEIVDTRNTKPPLLFWQAMVAGQWGQGWSLWVLRLPSIFYTFATTGLLALFTFKISGRLRDACLAAALYLLFFSTFRYGRVYLTSAPETFWLALPMWWLLWKRLPAAVESSVKPLALGWLAYTLFGLAWGLGAAYKSFALIAPAAAAFWAAVLLSEREFNWHKTLHTTVGVGWSTAVGLGIFAVWFVLDPDPAAVWQEFIVAENAGKMSGGQGYWHAALFGAYPMWTQLLAYPENAGLLFFIVIGFFWAIALTAFQRATYRQLAPYQWVLLVWLAIWLIVFTLPSQRSARYLIPAMPALAIVVAFSWNRIHRFWFWVSLGIALPALVMLARIGWVMGTLEITSAFQVAIICIAAGAGITWAMAGFGIKNTKTAALVGVLAVYGTFSAMVQPLSQPDAGYEPQIQSRMQGQRVAVPNGFTGQFERFHFVLPGAKITPYDAEGRNTGAWNPEMPPQERLRFLLTKFDAVVWLQDTLAEETPSCAPDCEVLGWRWHVKSRHKSGEITLKNLWHPDQWLFRKEWLIRQSKH
jgi:4-amino-4-deoxy-L-arabinose transferase-like glycosyltransferase